MDEDEQNEAPEDDYMNNFGGAGGMGGDGGFGGIDFSKLGAGAGGMPGMDEAGGAGEDEDEYDTALPPNSATLHGVRMRWDYLRGRRHHGSQLTLMDWRGDTSRHDRKYTSDSTVILLYQQDKKSHYKSNQPGCVSDTGPYVVSVLGEVTLLDYLRLVAISSSHQ